MTPRRKVPFVGPCETDREKDGADEDVEAVKARRHVESRAVVQPLKTERRMDVFISLDRREQDAEQDRRPETRLQPLTVAVDQRVVPLGVPVFLATTFPNTKTELNRLMVAQDTGGAIYGAVRADFYWGFGDAAGSQAGRMKQQGRMWVLLPKGYDPNAPLVVPSKTQ